MVRSLHLKLVLIMMLIIISLMAVLGTFLINSMANFYLDEFSGQMSGAFSDNAGFVNDLRKAASGDDGPSRMREVLMANSGNLGIDPGYREFYVLDATTAAYLAGSDDESGRDLDVTPNILAALSGKPGSSRRITDTYIDVAVPISSGDTTYIVYIKDTRQRLQNQTLELFTIILEALLFSMIISVVLSFLLSKTMTTPIESLTRGAKYIAAGDFEHKLEVQSHDEIGVLTQTFNNMSKVLKDTLEAVGSERDKLSTLFLHMTDGVVAFSRDASMMHVNPAAEHMLGIENGKASSFGEIFDGIANMQEIFLLRQPSYKELDCTIGERDLKLFFAPFGGEDSEGGVMAVIHDITEQTHMEKVRREFVANVSHELRTPLTNIRSYAETLAEDDSIDPKTAKSFLQVILNEVDRMTRIVKDLLTLSRLDYGKMDWKTSLFSPAHSLEEVCRAIRLEAQRRRHELLLEIPDDLPDMTGDRERIEQVFINILSNSIKYTPEGGRIVVRAGAQDGFLNVTVSDNGIGIPEKDIPRLFERFYRVDKARARESGGTGLGLAIAAEIVHHHGGRIDVKSAPGEGTAVTISLPLRRQETEQIQAIAGTQPV